MLCMIACLELALHLRRDGLCLRETLVPRTFGSDESTWGKKTSRHRDTETHIHADTQAITSRTRRAEVEQYGEEALHDVSLRQRAAPRLQLGPHEREALRERRVQYGERRLRLLVRALVDRLVRNRHVGNRLARCVSTRTHGAE